MTEIRSVADSVNKNVYYPQTHYKAVIGFDKGVRAVLHPQYLKDLHSIKESGLFYFDKNTKNKPSQVTKGFVQAVFFDDKNGEVELLTTSNFYEIKDGIWSDLKSIQSII